LTIRICMLSRARFPTCTSMAMARPAPTPQRIRAMSISRTAPISSRMGTSSAARVTSRNAPTHSAKRATTISSPVRPSYAFSDLRSIPMRLAARWPHAPARRTHWWSATARAGRALPYTPSPVWSAPGRTCMFRLLPSSNAWVSRSGNSMRTPYPRWSPPRTSPTCWARSHGW